jgi:Heterokaryon incompatibility protein (HET)
MDGEREKNDDAAPYFYKPLPVRAVRLLRIPEPGIIPSWSLDSYDLASCPSYVCLSYTWGPPLDTEECKAEYDGVEQTILVRSSNYIGRLRVGLNLWEGLEQLLAAGYTGHLWVDAICIDQDDPAERSSQVGIMGHIFATCEQTIVWLGKNQSNLEDFSWFHDTLLPAFEKHCEEGGLISDLMETVLTANLGIDPLSRWKGYVLFYEQRRWFHRSWILQEVALARNIAVFCGSASLNFEDFCDLSWYLHDLGAAIVPRGWKPEGINTELMVGHKGHRLASMRDACQMVKSHTTDAVYSVTGAETELHRYFAFFLSTLSAVHGFQASDQRDKVYAALGMAAKFFPTDENMIIVPDYSLTTAEVYVETATCLVQNLPYLAVLSLVQDRSLRVLSELPSWVPDFSSHYESTTYASRYEGYAHKACISGKNRYPRAITGSTLVLRGANFDTVTNVLEAMSNYRTDDGQPRRSPTVHNLELCSRLLNFLSTLERKYVNGQSRLEALSRTLILNQIGRGPPPADSCQLFRDWLLNNLAIAALTSRRMDEAHVELQTCMESLQMLDEIREMSLPSEEALNLHIRLYFSTDITVVKSAPSHLSPEEIDSSEEEEDEDKVWIHYNLYNRGLDKGLFLRQRLYTTSRGYIGLGPLSMEPGDQVCFLYDSTVPFILRPDTVAQQYTLIGETYLHGFMNGEVLQTDFADRIGPMNLL